MIRTSRMVEHVTFASTLYPEITSSDEHDAALIEWGDANPVAWKIVMGTRSKPFKRGSSTYLGCSDGKNSSATLFRLATFKRELERDDPFFGWRAKYTLAHYSDRGFKGGFFQQWDGRYHRGCADLDYTPATLEEVIDRFVAWCGSTFETVEVHVDKKCVRKA